MSYSDKIARLEKSIGELTDNIVSKEKCMPTMVIVAIVSPLIIFLSLFFFSPSFVQRKDNTKYTRNNKKVFFYTLGFSLAIWGLIYLYTLCSGYDRTAMVCSRM